MDKQATENAVIILDAYFNYALPEEQMERIRRWLLSNFNQEEKFEAMYRLFKQHIKLNREFSHEARISFEEIARKLNLAGPGEEGYKKMRAGIPLTRIMKSDYWETRAERLVESHCQAANPQRRLLIRRNLVRYSAAAAVTLCVGAGAWLHFGSPHHMPVKQVAISTVEVPDTTGAQNRTLLPDGSRILVRPGSMVRYAENFAVNRKVELTGEAYFAVEKDSLHQFTVGTASLNVSVLGTMFNIEAWPGSPFTIVSLYKGRVEVKDVKGMTQTAVEISSGHRLLCDNITGDYRIEQIYDPFPGWIADRLNFRNASYNEIFRAYEWYYGMKINVEGKPDNEVYTFRIRGGETIETALSLVQDMNSSLTYIIADGTVTVKMKH